ncbi:MAG: hydrolase [Phycisphaerales bacterium]|nr:hydrolase [Phycisphaerales bacterium]
MTVDCGVLIVDLRRRAGADPRAETVGILILDNRPSTLDTRLVMPTTERSAGFVVFHVRPGDGPAAGRVVYLLLDYGRHWDFAKGHVEPGEDDLAAATRELREETGIATAAVAPGFAHEVTYFFRHKAKGLVRKTVVFFLARAATDAVALSHEHVGYAFLPVAEAVRRVTFANAKQVLRLADQHVAAHPELLGEG